MKAATALLIAYALQLRTVFTLLARTAFVWWRVEESNLPSALPSLCVLPLFIVPSFYGGSLGCPYILTLRHLSCFIPLLAISLLISWLAYAHRVL